jgi:predicted RNA-binding Zn-ribbon protein involved in translation (DUF1610 family)
MKLLPKAMKMLKISRETHCGIQQPEHAKTSYICPECIFGTI